MICIMDHIEIISPSYKFDDTKKPVIPKILHLIWVGEDAAPANLELYKSQWRTLMPHWTIRLWTNVDLHEGEFSPLILRNIQKATKGAQKADIMRYAIMYKYGGVYMDADIIPYRSLDPILSLGREVVLCHDLPLTWSYIAIGFFASIPNHPLFKSLCDACSTELVLNTSDIHMKTGPRLFGIHVFRVIPTEPYVLLPIYSFYRNIRGQLNFDSIKRTSDDDTRFGSHTYAKMW